ncbi:putative uncharacterized conserved secreted protein [Synechococcus sp. PROS-7-1]|uniref:hypothetical protein n=1 Tax=Synechococcus sp. PROS-7-1 TaxID=1442556 RepID=UPI0016488D1A|nr:hypothetical protein [Synechococcus sp. PROS-7-1]QNI84314.1 putative uncharacterized conserved secreted protein [Synechococcus sp. PROS-7-1]
MPTLPPRLELVLLLSAAATGYNLTMKILPSQRIDLAQLEVEERVQTSEAFRSTRSPSGARAPVSRNPAPAVVMDVAVVNNRGTCAVPPSGGPALNDQFEPC